MEIPFITPNVYEGCFPVNWYYQKQGFNGRPCLMPTPGLLEWADSGYAAEVRGCKKLDADFAYITIGNRVYRSDTSGSLTLCTGTLNSSTGIVQMETNGVYVMIVDDINGYYVNGTTLTQITDPDFPVPSSLTYQDGYFIVTKDGTGEHYISGLNDPTTWDSSDYADAEGSPDNAIRAFVDHRELLIFGEDSTEPYENTGDVDYPFKRIEGAFIESGLAAKHAVSKLDNTVCWLADDFMIKAMMTYTPAIVSPEVLCRIIMAYTAKSDAFAYSYKDSGNSFFVITFPSANKTWVYNTATQAWHQWSSGMNERRHRSNCHMFFAGKNLVGDMENGKIYELSNATYTDDGEIIRRKRISPPLFDPNQKVRLTYNQIEIEFKAGVGLITGQGSDPQVMLRYSDNNLKTWSNEKWRGIGKIGEYGKKAVWHMLGSSRMRNFELIITDPIEAVVINAYANVSRNLS